MSAGTLLAKPYLTLVKSAADRSRLVQLLITCGAANAVSHPCGGMRAPEWSYLLDVSLGEPIGGAYRPEASRRRGLEGTGDDGDG